MSEQHSTNNFAIAIDGPAASGKSTVARLLAQRLELIMINTGAMYRALAWATIQKSVDVTDHAAVMQMLGDVDVSCGVKDSGSIILIDGVDPGEALRQDGVNNLVSKVAAIPEVRKLLVKKQRDYLALSSLVMEGRDIGSVVFPDTPYNCLLYTSPSPRDRQKSRMPSSA